MALNKYQVFFDEDGDIVGTVKLPDDANPKKRSVIVRAATKNQAERTAERLYSLAE
jgi:hypothetical protein